MHIGWATGRESCHARSSVRVLIRFGACSLCRHSYGNGVVRLTVFGKDFFRGESDPFSALLPLPRSSWGDPVRDGAWLLRCDVRDANLPLWLSSCGATRRADSDEHAVGGRAGKRAAAGQKEAWEAAELGIGVGAVFAMMGATQRRHQPTNAKRFAKRLLLLSHIRDEGSAAAIIRCGGARACGRVCVCECVLCVQRASRAAQAPGSDSPLLWSCRTPSRG